MMRRIGGDGRRADDSDETDGRIQDYDGNDGMLLLFILPRNIDTYDG